MFLGTFNFYNRLITSNIKANNIKSVILNLLFYNVFKTEITKHLGVAFSYNCRDAIKNFLIKVPICTYMSMEWSMV